MQVIFSKRLCIVSECVKIVDMSYERNDKSVESDFEVVNHRNKKAKKLLNFWRKEVNWEIEEERYDFLDRLFPLFNNWKGQLPDLRNIFRKEEIECIVSDAINYVDHRRRTNGEIIVNFIACSGYKNEPDVDENGEPSSRRTTPLHHAVKKGHGFFIPDLFKIYDRLDVNYTDDSGLTHFHAACVTGLVNVVEKFLVLDQDPNVVWKETGDTPLHLALERGHSEVAELLLRNDADPNLSNERGWTPLHIVCKKCRFNDLTMLFKLSNDKYKPLQTDALDKLGNTPLHFAVTGYRNEVAEFLLRRDVDPTLANEEGSTPLHVICKRDFYDDLAETFFKIIDEKHRTVQIDARDKLGRTPLQLAVANLQPRVVDLLLDRGADLSSFVFPTESDFTERFKWRPEICINVKLLPMSCALAIVERLEKRGYELDRSDTLTIIKFFAKYGLFETSTDPEKCCYDDRTFEYKAKEMSILPSLSLYDFVRLPLKEAEKLLTSSDYFEFACSRDYEFFPEESSETCAAHVCEIMARGFFRRWGLEFFFTLTGHRLPILCCEKITEMLMNQDLCRVCLAATGQSS